MLDILVCLKRMKNSEKLDGKYYERVLLPAKVCPMVLLTWGHFGI